MRGGDFLTATNTNQSERDSAVDLASVLHWRTKSPDPRRQASPAAPGAPGASGAPVRLSASPLVTSQRHTGQRKQVACERDGGTGLSLQTQCRYNKVAHTGSTQVQSGSERIAISSAFYTSIGSCGCR
uniref:Uncharacterized protein n=1 Tax=Knipowitschia caucasica TaxID=637954 RepID=A0AAV2LFT4_KNICA